MPLPVKRRYDVTISHKEIPKYFLREEVIAILAQIKRQPDHLIVNMLWRTGARVSELLMIRVEDIDSYTKTIHIITLKQKVAMTMRTVPIIEPELTDVTNPTPFQDEIEKYIEDNNLVGKDRLFKCTRQRVNQIMIRACKKAGLDRERAHPHTLRHSFAVNAVINRIPPYVLQKILGHADPSSTAIYANVLMADAKSFFNGAKW